MSDNKEKKTHSCIYCGANIKFGEVYCPECGKLNVQMKTNDTLEKKNKKAFFQRTCSGCGSIIASDNLEQCHICNTMLDEVPKKLKTTSQESVGFIFDWNKSKKLQPLVKKENWNLKEGIQVFELTILIYFIFLITIYFFLLQLNPNYEANIFMILLQLSPYCLLGIAPIVYIINKKNKFIKLGFINDSKSMILALIIGIFGGITLFVIEFLSNMVLASFVSLGFQGFTTYNENVLKMHNIVQSSGPWLFIYIILIVISTISIEIAYRGVLHKSLSTRFNKTNYDKIIVILIVALVYAGIESLFMNFIDIFVSLYFLVYNTITFIILGILFEINRNIYTTLVAHLLFSILMIITIIYL